MTATAGEISVYKLLEELCQSVYKDVRTAENAAAPRAPRTSVLKSNDKNQTMPDKLLKKCKIRAYQILLKRGEDKLSGSTHLDEGFSELIDPIAELRYSQFEYNLFLGQMSAQFHAYGHVSEAHKAEIMRKVATFEECLHFIETEPYFVGKHSDGYAVLTLFAQLKNSGKLSSSEPTTINVSPFSIKPDKIASLDLPEPKIFTLNWASQTRGNPYCGALVENKILDSFQRQLTKCENVPQTQPQSSPHDEDNMKRNLGTRCTNTVQYTSNKWEQFGCRYVLQDKDKCNECKMKYETQFASEAPKALLNFMASKALSQRQLFQARFVNHQLFIEHVKSLLVGIESDSFVYDHINVTFRMVDYLTVENVLPASMKSFVHDFLECGTCYKRLKKIAARNSNNLKLKYDGFVFKVMQTQRRSANNF